MDVPLNDSGSNVIRARVADKDGESTDYLHLIQVANVAPTVSVVREPAPGEIVAGKTLSFEIAANDVSPVDLAAGLAVEWTALRDGTAYATGTGAPYEFVSAAAGNYVVTARVTDKHGGVTVVERSYSIVPAAPVAAIVPGQSAGVEGTPMTYAASPGDAGLQYAWTAVRAGVVVASGSAADFAFTPADNGSYAVSLTVTDSRGRTATAAVNTPFANAAPAVAITPGQTSAVEGQTLTFAGVATDVAADAASLTYAWSAVLTGVTIATGNAKNFSFVATDDGNYALSLTVGDKDGLTGTQRLTVSVN